MSRIEDDLRRALERAAANVEVRPGAWYRLQERAARSRRNRRTAVATVGLAAAAIAVFAVVSLGGPDETATDLVSRPTPSIAADVPTEPPSPVLVSHAEMNRIATLVRGGEQPWRTDPGEVARRFFADLGLQAEVQREPEPVAGGVILEVVPNLGARVGSVHRITLMAIDDPAPWYLVEEVRSAGLRLDAFRSTGSAERFSFHGAADVEGPVDVTATDSFPGSVLGSLEGIEVADGRFRGSIDLVRSASWSAVLAISSAGGTDHLFQRIRLSEALGRIGHWEGALSEIYAPKPDRLGRATDRLTRVRSILTEDAIRRGVDEAILRGMDDVMWLVQVDRVGEDGKARVYLGTDRIRAYRDDTITFEKIPMNWLIDDWDPGSEVPVDTVADVQLHYPPDQGPSRSDPSPPSGKEIRTLSLNATVPADGAFEHTMALWGEAFRLNIDRFPSFAASIDWPSVRVVGTDLVDGVARIEVDRLAYLAPDDEEALRRTALSVPGVERVVFIPVGR